MLRSQAIEAGYEIDDRPPIGLSGRGSFGVRREFMTQRERAEVFNATGVHVEDAAGKRRAFAATGARPAEKGERAYDRWDAFANERSGGGSDRLTSLESVDLWGDEARRKPFDAHEAMRRHEARIARGEPYREA